MNTSLLVERARAFAIAAHERVGQRRKYTGEPYWTHPEAVAAHVATVTDDEALIAAAWLHDTLEDTDCTLQQIRMSFGPRVAGLVDDLTDPSRPEDGNRSQRKAIDRGHTARAHPDAKTVKLADLIHNTGSIVAHDPRFARVYLDEKALLLEVLKEGNAELYRQAQQALDRARKALRDARGECQSL